MLSFLKKELKEKGLSAPRIQMKIEPTDDEKEGTEPEPEKVDIPVTKPKKLKTTVKLPGKKRPKKQKQSESVVLEVPPESIIYQDILLEND